MIIHDIVQWLGAALGFVLPIFWIGFNSSPEQVEGRRYAVNAKVNGDTQVDIEVVRR